MKNWFKSKTMWLSFAMGFVGLAETTMSTAPLEPQTMGIVTMAFGLLSGVIRHFTSGPLSDK